MAWGDQSSQAPMPPRTPGGGWSTPIIAPGAGYNAMLNEFLREFQTERGRRGTAFGYWTQGKENQLDAYQQAKMWKQREYEDRIRREQEAKRLALEAERKAREERQRQELIAQGREQSAIQTSMRREVPSGLPHYGGSLAGESKAADLVEYGYMNPAGRPGGSNASQVADYAGQALDNAESNQWRLNNCLQDPAGPGCDSILASNGYMMFNGQPIRAATTEKKG